MLAIAELTPKRRPEDRLRAVSYFSLQSYCTRNPSTRAAINEGVSPRRKKKETGDSFVLSGENELIKQLKN